MNDRRTPLSTVWQLVYRNRGSAGVLATGILSRASWHRLDYRRSLYHTTQEPRTSPECRSNGASIHATRSLTSPALPVVYTCGASVP